MSEIKMRKVMRILVGIFFLISTRGVAAEYVLGTFTVWGIPERLAEVKIEVTPTSTTLEKYTNRATVTITGRIFDSFRNPLEGAQANPTTSREFLWKIEVLDKVFTGIAKKKTPGIEEKIIFTKIGTFTGTVTVEEGPVELGAPIPSLVIPSTTTVYSTFTVTILPPPIATLTTLVIVPEVATITVGEVKKFTIEGFDQWNNSIPVTEEVIWTATAGTITQKGTFTAPTTPGIAIITARIGNIVGTATVYITPGAIAKIEIEVEPKIVAIGEKATVTARAMDKYGNKVPSTFTWKIIEGEGEVSPNVGTYTIFTPKAVGTVTIAAESKEVFGTATITVIAKRVLTYLEILPGIATITVGSESTFVAIAKDQYGSKISIPGTVSWSISESGLGKIISVGKDTAIFIAGTKTMEGKIIATFGNISGTANVRLIPGKIARIRIENQPEMIPVGVWYQGTITVRAEDIDGNTTIFKETGTCTIYLVITHGSSFPNPGEKLWFSGNVSTITLPRAIKVERVGETIGRVVVYLRELK
jgi:hypothetical protein